MSLELSIVIVNWNSVHFLEKCLHSIYDNTQKLTFEVIVVDNASYDGSQQMVHEKFPSVIFIQSPKNEGFAKANNRAFQHSRGSYILFLNPDTELRGPALSSLVHFLATTPDAGIVGPTLLNSDLTVQTTTFMRFPSPINEALAIDYFRSAVHKRTRRKQPKAGGTVVEAVSGACLMIRRSVFEQVDGFTTDYFMYSEDLDLCYKTRHAGWTTYYYGHATVIHRGGGSTTAASFGFQAVLTQDAHLTFLRKRRGSTHALAYRISITLIATARIAITFTIIAFTLGRFERQRLQSSSIKWLNILRWAIGRSPGAEWYIRHNQQQPSPSQVSTTAYMGLPASSEETYVDGKPAART